MTKISKLVFGRQMLMFGCVGRLPQRTNLTGSFLVATLRGFGTDWVRAWALGKEDAKAYWRMWRGVAKAPASVVQAP